MYILEIARWLVQNSTMGLRQHASTLQKEAVQGSRPESQFGRCRRPTSNCSHGQNVGLWLLWGQIAGSLAPLATVGAKPGVSLQQIDLQ